MEHKLILGDGSEYLLRPMLPKDLDETVAFCDACVGQNLYSKETLADTIGSADRFVYLLSAADGQTVGYIYYYLTNADSVAEHAKSDPAVFRAVCPDNGILVGKIQSVGLKEGYRGIGLASLMIRFALENLKSYSVDTVFIICWKVGEVVPLKKALTDCAFRYLRSAKKVWYDDLDLICPHCGGRCHCDAEIYFKPLV